MRRNFVSILLALLISSNLFAQRSDFLDYSGVTDKTKYTSGEEIRVVIALDIKKPYHIYPYKVNDPLYITTTLKIDTEDFETVSYHFPEFQLLEFEFSDTKLWVYEGETLIGMVIKSTSGLQTGEYKIPVILNYQACDDKVCYPPVTETIEIQVIISNESGIEQNSELFAAIDFATPTDLEDDSQQTLTENVRTAVPPSETQVTDFIEDNGLILSMLFLFLGGLALNLTPCVYPLIPITISYFGSQASGSKAQSIFMGIFYALGISVTYSALGLFAALTGSLLGTALQNPFVVLFVVAVLIALGASMFGAFEIRVPQKIALAGNKNRKGFFGSMVMGLLVGFIAAPCIGPFVLSLLVYVGQIGDAVLGFSMFFVLSMGLGFPYIFLAAFSSSLNKLPRSGEWMEGVKIIFGLVMFGLALYTLEALIQADIFRVLFPAYIILCGIYLLMLSKKGNTSPVFLKIKYIFAIFAIMYGTWNLKPEGATEKLEWKELNTLSEIERVIESGDKPVMIDFHADWCAQCKELDRYTYSDKEIIDLSKSFNNIKIDLTRENREITDKYEIRGLPVVLFANSNGEEIRGLRVTGFLNVNEFREIMNSVLENEKQLTSSIK